MRLPNDAALLDIWEQGQGLSPVAQAKLLLAAALPGLDEAALGEIRISTADVAFLRLRRAIFGASLPAETACGRCAERLEFELDVETLIDGLARSSEGDSTTTDRIRFREPTIADLVAVAGACDVDAALRGLAALCWLDDQAASPSEVEIAEIDKLYGQAAIRLRLNCAACGQTWNEVFDVAAYLWEELEQRALTRLDEIHVLASAYGWSEPQVLALSDSRRSAYLRRCGA